jgi:hypothetical protein
VSPVKYELGFYMPEDDILQSQRRNRQILHTEVLLMVLSICGIFMEQGSSDGFIESIKVVLSGPVSTNSA